MSASFLDEFYALVRLHDVQTFALVGKDRDGEPIVAHRAWRVEDPPREQRASAAITHMDLHGLANAVLGEQWLPREDETTVPDPEVAIPAAPEPEIPTRPDGPGGTAWGDIPEGEDGDKPFVPD